MLHFYVVDLQRDARGILSYRVAVRSLDGAGPHARGVSATAPATLSAGSDPATLNVTVRNTGTAASVSGSPHPQDASAFTGGDIYRLSVAIDGDGWSADLRNALVALKPGEFATVPVRVRRSPSGRQGRVTFTAVSESDPSKQAVVMTTIAR